MTAPVDKRRAAFEARMLRLHPMYEWQLRRDDIDSETYLFPDVQQRYELWCDAWNEGRAQLLVEIAE